MKVFIAFIVVLLTISSNSFSQPIPPDPGIVVPIQLLAFHAKLDDSYVELSWQTDIGNKNGKFETEFCIDGKTWNATNLNNSNFLSENGGFFTDKHLIANIESETIYYRLKNTTIDGAIFYSKNISIQLKKVETKLTSLNFSNQILTIDLFSTNEQIADISIYTIAGNKIASRKISLNKGNSALNIPFNNINKGVIVMVITGLEKNIVHKFYAN